MNLLPLKLLGIGTGGTGLAAGGGNLLGIQVREKGVAEIPNSWAPITLTLAGVAGAPALAHTLLDDLDVGRALRLPVVAAAGIVTAAVGALALSSSLGAQR